VSDEAVVEVVGGPVLTASEELAAHREAERLVASRMADLRIRVGRLLRSGLLHDGCGALVDMAAAERAVELLERVLGGERVAVRLGVPPPVAKPGRGRGFRFSGLDDGEGEE
jgi:hypothetical protein